MTKKLTPWEKMIRRCIRHIRAGKIQPDNNIYLIDCDGLQMMVRGDLLPLGYDMIHRQLNGQCYEI